MTSRWAYRLCFLEHRYLKEPYREFEWEDFQDICRFLRGFQTLWPKGKGAPAFALQQYQRVDQAFERFWPRVVKIHEKKQRREKEERKRAAEERKQAKEEIRRAEEERKKAEEETTRRKEHEQHEREEQERKKREKVEEITELELKRIEEEKMRGLRL